jgi:hypothetical protein
VWTYGQTQFDALHQLGVDWARMDVWWSLVEPEPGMFDWAYFDRAIASYAENDIRLMAILCYAAAWSDEAPVTEEARQAFGDYVYATVLRYRDTVHEWEIWNEPNILPFWAPRPDVRDYAALLRVAYARAKEADPTCVVVGSATAGADFAFVQGLFENGAGDSFDVLSYHAYGNHPWREAVQGEAWELRAILDEHGRHDAPIWLSEQGIFTGPGGVDERSQARDIVRMHLWRAAAGVERSMYLSLRDWHAEDDAAEARDFWGVMNHAGEAKESFWAVKTLTDAMRGRPFVNELQLAPEVEAYLFGGQGDNRVALFAADGPVTFTLDAGVVHLVTESLLGEERLLTSADHMFTFDLTIDPLWLHNVGPGLVLQGGIESEPVVTRRGWAGTTEVTVRNTLRERATIELDAEPPRGFVVSGVPTTMVLDADVEARAWLEVTPPMDATPGETALPLTVRVSDTARPMAARTHVAWVYVTPPFEATLLKARRVTEESTIPVEVEVVTIGGTPMELTSRLILNGEVVDEVTANSTSEGPAWTVTHALVSVADIATGEEIEVEVVVSGEDHLVELTDSMRLFPTPRRAHDVTVDGDLSEWRAVTPTFASPQFTEVDFNPNLASGEADIAAQGWMAWSEEGVWLAFEVWDDAIDLPTDQMVWNHDGLQIGFDPVHDSMVGADGYDDDDFEIELGLREDGEMELYAGHQPPGRPGDLVAEHCEAAVVRTETGLAYEVFVPAAVPVPLELKVGSLVGFNVIQNDNDGDGREGWLELAPGIGWGKEPWTWGTVVLVE